MMNMKERNDEYELFVIAHIEAAAKGIATKLRSKCRVPWESIAVQENKIRWKKQPYLKETQQTPRCRNLRKSQENWLKHTKKNN